MVVLKGTSKKLSATIVTRMASNCIIGMQSDCGGKISGVKTKQLATQHGVLRAKLVEGKSVKDIFLDKWCSRTLLHQSLMPKSKLKEVNAVAIR